MAAELVLQFTARRTADEFQEDAMLRSAVERQLEIIGEAVGRLVRSDPEVANQLTDYRRIVSFRNILIHGYDAVDAQVVWDVVAQKLPVLYREVVTMLTGSS